MANIYNFQDRRTIESEAIEWLVKLDGDQPPSKEDLDNLTQWLSRSPLHCAELNSLNAFWCNNILTELMVPLGKGAHESKSTALVWLGQQIMSYKKTFSLAVMGLFTATLVLFFYTDANHVMQTNGVYATAVGQQKTMVLSDNSVIHLDTNSQIEVAFNQKNRNVRLLQGQVHFDVAKDAEHPFRVYAGDGRVQAVGTAFTVNLNNADFNVLVTEGSVALAIVGEQPFSHKEALIIEKADRADPYVRGSSKQLAVLKVGQSASLYSSETSTVAEYQVTPLVENVSAKELAKRQSWRDGLLVFTGEPLAQVIAEVSRYTTVTIEISDPVLENLQIGGRFKVGELDEMFNALESNFGLQITRPGYNRVQLSLAESSQSGSLISF